jgi:hypothetical protein
MKQIVKVGLLTVLLGSAIALPVQETEAITIIGAIGTGITGIRGIELCARLIGATASSTVIVGRLGLTDIGADNPSNDTGMLI